MRVPQLREARKSQRWMQEAVNLYTAALNERVARAFGLPTDDELTWLSPLSEDGFAEYRDESFLDRLSIDSLQVPLSSFWPAKGPQWDALARTKSGKLLLVEAKAHISEGIPCRTKASSPESLAKIARALEGAKAAFGAAEDAIWERPFFQHANRLTHLHFLRGVNQLDAYLLFLYFANAPDTSDKERTSAGEWQGAKRAFEAGLGLPRRHRYERYVRTVIWSVEDMLSEKLSCRRPTKDEPVDLGADECYFVL